MLPEGLKYVDGSAVLSRVEGGRDIPLSSARPVGVRVLVFGIPIEEGTDTLRPIDFNAGETLRLRYQAVVDASARPRTVYTNRVRLLAEGNVPISAVAEADVRVLADPDFDQGVLLGRVFCDDDENGVQGPGERGAPGVYLYMDHGYEVVTDSHGLFHFKDIDPGTHMVKLDQRSLLPGSRLTTAESRVISFTRGLPARIQFGVTCPSETVTESSSEVTDAGLAAALRAWSVAAFPVKAQLEPFGLLVGDRGFQSPRIDLAHTISPTGSDGGALVVVQASVSQPAAWTTWSLLAGRSVDTLETVASGREGIPPRMEWRRGKALASGPWVYQLEMSGASGVVVRSPLMTVAAGKQALTGTRNLGRFSADQIGESLQLSAELKADLKALKGPLTETQAPVVVRVHHDNSKGPFIAVFDSSASTGGRGLSG